MKLRALAMPLAATLAASLYAQPTPTTTAQPTEPQPTASGQYILSENGSWVPVPAPAQDDTLSRARAAIAENRPLQALRLLDPWIKQQTPLQPPELAQAFLSRGDAKVALGDEMEALYDYERVIRYYAASEQFALALERELEIGTRYLAGLRSKGWFGIRYENATEMGEELLIRVQERIPGSQLAERAGIELADYYYRVRDLKMALEAYDVFLKLYPRSEYRQRAELRRIFASIAQFKGPAYDAQPLREAQERVRRFAAQYPAEAEQTGISDALATRLEESAAAHTLEVARWYLRRDELVSAKLTLRRLLRSAPHTVAARYAEEIFRDQGWPLPEKSPKPVDEPASPPPPPPPAGEVAESARPEGVSEPKDQPQ